VNRLRAGFRRRKPSQPAAKGAKRTATPGKGRGPLVVWLLIVVFGIPQGVMFSGRVVARLADAAEEAAGDRVPIRVRRYRKLEDLAKGPQDEEALEKVRSEFRSELLFPPGHMQFDFELDAAEKLRLEEWLALYRERGPDSFRPSRADLYWPESSSWPSAAHEDRFLHALAALFTLLFAALLLTSLGIANQDLGRVEWTLEWLFTFPARARSLFVAKTLEYALVSPFSFFLTLPLAFAVFLAAGSGWAALPLALFVTLYVNLLGAAARVVLETWLRKRLPLARLKNVQAVASVLGTLAFYVLLYLALAPQPPSLLPGLAAAVPEGALWLPWALPVLIAKGGAGALAAGGALVLIGALALFGGAALAGRLVRNGLVSTGGGVYQGRRGAPAAERRAGASFHGVLSKDLKLLRRDRSFLVQTLVVPVLIMGFQVAVHPGLLEAGARDLRHGAALAFGIGAYVLMFGGFSVITAERQCLWLLFTFPQPLVEVLRRKTRLWAVVALAYTAGVLAVILARTSDGGAVVVENAVLALAGVVIYAFIASGLAVLGADPLSEQPQTRVRPGMAYLYMLLASMYGYGIYAPGAWQKLAFLVLTSLLAFALWQKAADRLPYLLDPVAAPPPRVSLSDGLIAALAFFVFQGVLLALLVGSAEGVLRAGGAEITAAFVLAGLATSLGATFFLSRAGVPCLLEEVGVERQSGAHTTARAWAVGLLYGGAAAACGLLYLEALERLEPLRALRDEAERLTAGMGERQGWWIAALSVLAAPVFEEFIFRGLIFRGLRRSLPVLPSVLASAAIFAIVHPQVSVAPVFLLGVAAALSFERTGRLYAPIACHMVYNAAVILREVG
jgi:hypothetical protein